MSTLIQWPGSASGQALYYHLRDAAGQVFNVPSDQFQGYSSGQWANYSQAFSEQGASAIYLGNIPGTIQPQSLLLVVYLQAGGSPAEGDAIQGSEILPWDGSDVVSMLSRASASQVTAVAAQLAQVLGILPANTNGFADVLLDRANGVETALTPRQALRLIGAALAGVLTGAPGTTIEIKGAGVGKTRITATVDSNGNRPTVVLDVTD